MGRGRLWTEEEREYLASHYSVQSNAILATRLKRTIRAIKAMANYLGLGRKCDNGDYVTCARVFRAFRHRYGSREERQRFIAVKGIPTRNLHLNSKSYGITTECVKLEEFWQWADSHREALNWGALEPFDLGVEPEWVDKIRRAKWYANSKKRWGE